MCAVVILCCLPNPLMVIVIAPLFWAFMYAREYFRRSARETQRLVAITASPIFSSLEETLDGLATIRAYAATGTVVDTFGERMRLNSSFAWLKTSLDQWILIRLCFLGTCVVVACAIAVTLARSQVSPVVVGLALSYAMIIISDLRFFVRSMTDVEARLNAVDRLAEYAELTPEAPRQQAADADAGPAWPAAGALVLSNLKMSYRPGLPLVLRGVSASIAAGEQIGICGRTGSGKSTLVSTLFRIVDFDGGTSGSIFIDGVDTSRLGLATLRRKLMIVPQDP